MSMRLTWLGQVSAVVTGTGSGATQDVETAIPLPAVDGSLVAYRLRKLSGSGSPNWTIMEKTGQVDTNTAYNLFADLAASATADGPVIPTAEIPYCNRDTTQARSLYLVVENDGGAGDAVTIGLEVCVRYWDGGRN